MRFFFSRENTKSIYGLVIARAEIIRYTQSVKTLRQRVTSAKKTRTTVCTRVIRAQPSACVFYYRFDILDHPETPHNVYIYTFCTKWALIAHTHACAVHVRELQFDGWVRRTFGTLDAVVATEAAFWLGIFRVDAAAVIQEFSKTLVYARLGESRRRAASVDD